MWYTQTCATESSGITHTNQGIPITLSKISLSPCRSSQSGFSCVFEFLLVCLVCYTKRAILDTGWLTETVSLSYEGWKVQNEDQDLHWVKAHFLVTRQLSSWCSHIAEEPRALSGDSFLSTIPNHKGSILVPLIISHRPHPPGNAITLGIKILNAWVWGHKYWAHNRAHKSQEGISVHSGKKECGTLRAKSCPLGYRRDSCTWNVHQRSHLEFRFSRRSLRNY